MRETHISGSAGFWASKRTLALLLAGAAALLLASLLGLYAAVVAADPKELSPVEQVEQYANEIEALQEKMREAQRAGNNEAAQQIIAQMEKTKRAEEDYLKTLYDKVVEAMKAGRTEEVERLTKVYKEAALHGEYARSLQRARPQPAPIDVVFSEVCYWPAEGKDEWVELSNVSAKPVDVSGWVLMDGQTLKFDLPPKLAPVQPGGYVLIQFDGTGQPPSVDAEKKLTVVHTPQALKGNLLGDQGGHLALYAPGEFGLSPGVSTIRSHVAWGRSPGSILADAIAAKRWRDTSDIVPGTAGVKTFGFAKRLEQGGSVGCVSYDKPGAMSSDYWTVMAPSEVSPGGPCDPKKRMILPYLPRDRSGTGQDGKVMLSCQMMERGTRYHFQVCYDKECTKVFLDAPNLDLPYYPLDMPVPKGTTVYWRVQATLPDGTTTQWSSVRALENRN